MEKFILSFAPLPLLGWTGREPANRRISWREQEMQEMQANRSLLFTIIALTLMLTAFEVSQVHAQKTIFDVDLTQGNAGTGVVTGGVWDNGWRVTNKLIDRIVFDAGYKIADGYIETTLTIDSNPFLRDEKINYFGGYEEPHLSQGNSGDKIYLRTGKGYYKFSRPKGAGGPITLPNTVLENGPVPAFEQPDVGSVITWINSSDDVTVLMMKIEWKEGDQVNFFTSGGNITAPASVMENYPIDEIRYGFLGSDRTYNISLLGARFLSFKMVDYNAVPEPASGISLLIGCGILACARRCRPSHRGSFLATRPDWPRTN